jgi:uncharacterized protein YprB with RNaseH-like and TPR domain
VLRRTFLHAPGVGQTAERLLWDQGCTDWSHYLDAPGQFRTGAADPDDVRECLLRSEEALAEGRHQFFSEALGLRHAWRAWPEFRDRMVYLDIETDGGFGGDAVTCVGLYDGKDFQCLVRDDDLGTLPDVLSRYGMVVTFFGSGFDIPILRRAFPWLGFDQIHLDLCPTLKRIGYRGGLKRIEKEFGIDRGLTDGLDGRDAIRLWRSYQRGDDSALELLVAYNRQDVVNLERLAETAYSRLYEIETAGPTAAVPGP